MTLVVASAAACAPSGGRAATAPAPGSSAAPAPGLPSAGGWRESWAAPAREDGGGRWLTLADLQNGTLAGAFTLLTGAGTPAGAAVRYLTGWTAGALAGAVAAGLAGPGAALLPDPATLRFRQHPAGWFAGLDLTGALLLVPWGHAGHPWAGQRDVATLTLPPGTEPLGPLGRVARDALVDAVTPLLAHLRTLVPVAVRALWAQVADGAALGLASAALTCTDARIAGAVLTALLGRPGEPCPWPTRPRVLATGDRLAVRRGGCCLASTAPGGEYCATCSLRTDADSLARQGL